jgi:hypothetical protein
MRNTISLFLFSMIILVSCKKQNNSIDFIKTTEDSKIQITLHSNKTFDYKAKSTKGVAFHELGTFKILDSLLIIDYTNKEYSYNCYTIALPNDTFLIATVRDVVFLYPLIKEFPEVNKYKTNEDLMNDLVKEYNNKNINGLVGTKYLSAKKDDFEFLYTENSLISKHYDAFIKQ